MINLIPPEAQHHIITEYWFRVVAVWLLMLAVAVGVVVILLVPAYVLVTNQVRAYAGAATAHTDGGGEQGDTVKALAQANLYAEAVVQGARRQPLLAIFDAIQAVSVPDVVMIKNYTFTRSETGLAQIKVDGTALTRRELITFRDKLNEQPLIEKVDLPISNLAKDKDITFSLTLTIATTTPAT